MKLNELKAAGIADRACGSYAAVLNDIRDADARECQDLSRQIYNDMYAYTERLAEQIARLREFQAAGFAVPVRGNMRALDILDQAIKSLEEEKLV